MVFALVMGTGLGYSAGMWFKPLSMLQPVDSSIWQSQYKWTMGFRWVAARTHEWCRMTDQIQQIILIQIGRPITFAWPVSMVLSHTPKATLNRTEEEKIPESWVG